MSRCFRVFSPHERSNGDSGRLAAEGSARGRDGAAGSIGAEAVVEVVKGGKERDARVAESRGTERALMPSRSNSGRCIIMGGEMGESGLGREGSTCEPRKEDADAEAAAAAAAAGADDENEDEDDDDDDDDEAAHEAAGAVLAVLPRAW